MIELRQGNYHPIGSIAREIKSGTYPPFEPISDNPVESYTQGMKPERIAVTAVIIDAFINHSLDRRFSRGPFGLLHVTHENMRKNVKNVTQIPQDAPFQFIQARMGDTLEKDYNILMVDYTLQRIPEDTPLHQALRRFNQWEDVRTSSSFLRLGMTSGIATAVHAMSDLLETIPELYMNKYGEEPTVQKLMNIAKNSYGIVQGFSRMDIYTANRLSHKIFDTESGCRPDALELKQAGHGEAVVVSDQIVEDQKIINASYPEESFVRQNVVTGCPAAVSFDGSSPIKKLWEWNLELADYIWSRDFDKGTIIRG